MRSRYGWHGRLAVASAAAAAAFVVAAPANAASTVRLSGGTTSLKLDGKTARALRAAGIAVKATKPAKVRAGALVFPISGGSIDPANAKGTIDHKGGVTFSMGRAKVALTALKLNTAKRTVSAKAGRRTVALGSLRGGKVSRDGFATKLAGVKVKIGRAGAKALNRGLGVRTFKAGLTLGTAAIKPVTREIALERGTTTLAFLPQVVGALTASRIALTPIAPGALDPATGALTVPVIGGAINPTTFAGTIMHSGGVSIGGIPIADPTITIGASSTLSTTSLGAVADLDLSLIRPALDPRTGTLTVSGVGVRLNQTSETALRALGAPVAVGMQIATASLTATVR